MNFCPNPAHCGRSSIQPPTISVPILSCLLLLDLDALVPQGLELSCTPTKFERFISTGTELTHFQRWSSIFTNGGIFRCMKSRKINEGREMETGKVDVQHYKKVDLVQVSPWVRTITHIHIENSSLLELPPWLALSSKLHTLTIKSKFLCLTSCLRSAKLSGNEIDDIDKHLLLSKDIYDIDLSRNKITSFGSHTFSACAELRILDLSHNPIQILPVRPFAHNSKLKWLKLSGTSIKELSPKNFVGLGALKSLTLSYSPLQSIAPFAFLPLKSLKTLDLEATNISAIPLAVTQNCGLSHLNVANNILHHRSSLPPEVIVLLSGLTLLKLDGNPLTEFPPSLFTLSTGNFRLIRQLVQTMTSLPVWTEEPCTPYYWAMHLRNRSLTFRNLVSTWSDSRMKQEGLAYCREQYEWMIEEMEVYRDLEKNSGIDFIFISTIFRPHFGTDGIRGGPESITCAKL
ncbi:unnamed protein product [Haemonchus placei]|uniref:LRRCT domain-containing protein n=1 Tax=Haemonchus placei TaxID=6290 RepID=A0A158QNY6_HAEPC|nr:unnamed protein product [Haemonchus placei]